MPLSVKLTSRQVVIGQSPQMRAELRMLAMSGADLNAYVADELERNPFLVDRRGGHSLPCDILEQTPAHPISLELHLVQQLEAVRLPERERALGARLIGELDEDGYLRAAPQDLASRFGATVSELDAVLTVLRGFTPTGIFAGDLADCLSMQMAARDRLDPIADRVLSHLASLARHGPSGLAVAAGVSEEDARDVLADLAELSPRPAEQFARPALPPSLPDVIVALDGKGGLTVSLCAESAPRLTIDGAYFDEIATRTAGADLKFAQVAIHRARWLSRTLARRARTLRRTAQEIVARQEGFFRTGRAQMRPLSMRDIGDALKLHPSTISRVVANKLVASPQGTIELRSLFCGGLGHCEDEVSSESIRHQIRSLIASERTADGVLSDDEICTTLGRQGVTISRRTVAKYRDAMRVGSSHARRSALKPGMPRRQGGDRFIEGTVIGPTLALFDETVP